MRISTDRRRRVAVAIALGMCMPHLAVAEVVTVTTRENAIRSACQFFAPVVATVAAGDALEYIDSDGDWVQVAFQGKRGCIHISAVREERIAFGGLTADGGSGSVSDDEVSLAGKGFNPEVEAKYREGAPVADFDAVDEIETLSVAPARHRDFIEGGGLELP